MTTFDEVTTVRDAGAGRFDVDIHPAWTIGGKPNGGYLLALLARAAGSCTPHPHPLAVSAHYLQAPEPGPARIEVHVLRAGRSACQIRATLAQQQLPCVEVLLTLGTLEFGSAPFWSGGVPDVAIADIEDCVRVPPVNPMGLPVPIMGEVELRLDLATVGFAVGSPSGTGELRGWLALPDAAPFDPLSLLYAVDAFPPATFEVRTTGWVPTLELTVYVRALPAPGPVRVLHRAQLIEAGRVDEATWVWDSRGRLVAQGTQLAGIRLG